MVLWGHERYERSTRARAGRSWPRRSHPLLQQGSGLDPERVGELLEDRDGGVSVPVLHAAQVGLVDAGLESKLLLRPVFFQPVAPHVLADLLPNVHGPEQAARTVAGP